MSCRCCGSSSSTDLCKNCSSSYSSSSCSSSDESSSSSCNRKRRYNRKKRLPTAWEPGVDGYDEYCPGSCNGGGKIEACHNAGCRSITKQYVNRKGSYCYPKLSTNLLKSCEVDTCLLKAQCVKAVGGEFGDINVRGRILLNGKDINNEEESVSISTITGQTEIIPERPQNALTLPEPTLVPQGIFNPLVAGVNIPHYVSLYHVCDRRGIRSLNELKQLYSSILLLNAGEAFHQVSFVLFIYSGNSTPLNPQIPTLSYVLQPLDIDIQSMPPGAMKTFTVNWNSWRSCLNIIREAREVAIFTSVMVVGQPNDLAFLRTFTSTAEPISHRIYAVYNNYCLKDDCERERCNRRECDDVSEELL